MFGRSHQRRGPTTAAAERGQVPPPLRHQHICVDGGLEAVANTGVMARQQTVSESLPCVVDGPIRDRVDAISSRAAR